MNDMTKKTFIPQFSRKELIARAARIHTLLRDEKTGVLMNSTTENIFNAITFNGSTPTKVAPPVTEITRIKTYHRFSASVYLKPSIAEVMAQIPKEFLHQVDAFEVILFLQREYHDSDAWSSGFHTATTVLYKYA